MFPRAIVSWLLVAAAAAQAEPPHVLCKSCESHGSLPCKQHGKGMLEKEHAVQFCSAAAECKQCLGALALDCRSCRNEPVQKGIEERQKLAREWLAARRKAVDELTRNQPLWHLQTAHADLCFSIKPLTIGKEKVDTHPLMHLYGERIEALRALFLELLDLPAAQLPARLEIFMFRDQQDHSLIGPRVTGIGTSGSTGTKLMGANAVFSMWMDPRSLVDDEALHRNVVHNVTHLLLSNMQPSVWLGNRKHGWIDEGLAHWFEDKVTGKCTNFCFEEVLMQPGIGFKNGRWRAPVRQLVDAGKLKSFAEVSILNTDQLEMQDHAHAFACIDFLLTVHGGPKFRDFLRLVKKDQPLREALQAIYGLNPLTFDPAFQTWVKATYSPQEAR
jgi:hypothetical protein